MSGDTAGRAADDPVEVPDDGAIIARTGCEGGVLVIAFAPDVSPSRIAEVSHNLHHASGLKVIAVADAAAVKAWHPHDAEPAQVHATLLEEILRNADEDIKGADEAPEYLAEFYVRFLERERDQARADAEYWQNTASDIGEKMTTAHARIAELEALLNAAKKRAEDTGRQLDRANITIAELRAGLAECPGGEHWLGQAGNFEQP